MNICEEHDCIVVYDDKKCPVCQELRDLKDELQDLHNELKED